MNNSNCPADKFSFEEISLTIGRFSLIDKDQLGKLYNRIKMNDFDVAKAEIRFLTVCQHVYLSYMNNVVRELVSELAQRFLSGIYADKAYANSKDYGVILLFIFRFRNCKTLTSFRNCFDFQKGSVLLKRMFITI